MTSSGQVAQEHMDQTMNITAPNFHIDRPLALSSSQVHLWRLDLEALRGHESRWNEVLSPDELSRSARFHFPRDRQHFVASRAVLRTILGAYLDKQPARLNFIYSKKEKPFVDPIEGSDVTFNVSHSGGVALMAFTRVREIGVDIEHLRPDVDLESIAGRFFSAEEQKQFSALSAEDKGEAFFRCWTRKEAYIKATGDGLSLPLNQFDVALTPTRDNCLLATRPDSTEASRWLLKEVPGGTGYVAALCVRGADWQLKDWSVGPVA